MEKISDLFQLKKNSDHYYQIQCQLGVTGIKKAIYFVFTHHGHYIEEIEFEVLYKFLMEKVFFFWYNHLGNELLYPSVPNKETLNDSIKEPEPRRNNFET